MKFFYLLVATLLLSFTILSMPSCDRCNSIFNRFEVTGQVTNTGSRHKGNYKNAKEKYSVSLTNVTGDIPQELASDLLIVNCDSTQCASLMEGTFVVLSCYEQWGGCAGPNEIECRFKKMAGNTINKR